MISLSRGLVRLRSAAPPYDGSKVVKGLGIEAPERVKDQCTISATRSMERKEFGLGQDRSTDRSDRAEVQDEAGQ